MQAMKEQPDDPRPIALKARIDAMLGDFSYSEARGIYADLIVQHPDDVYLKAGAAVLMAQDGDRAGAITALRRLADDHVGDPLALQTLAVLLSADPATREEAWSHFKTSVASAPLVSPLQVAVAYRIGKQVEPAQANEALRGIGLVDRAAIRTVTLKNMGPQLLAIPAVLGLLLCSLRPSALGFGLLALATIWVAWCAYAASVVGSWKGVRRLLLVIPFLWFFAAVFVSMHDGKRWMGYVGAGVVLAARLILHAMTHTQRRKKNSAIPNEGVPANAASGAVTRPPRALSLAVVVALALVLAALPRARSTSSASEVRTSQGLIWTTGVRSAAPAIAMGSPIGKMIDRFGQTTLASFVLCGKSGCNLGYSAFCTDSNPCFGPAISNKEAGATYLFEAAETAPLAAANVSPPSGAVIDGYIQNFPQGTAYRDAIAKVLEYLPHDVRIGRLTLDHHGGECALLELTSATLGREFANRYVSDRQGIVEVEFTSRSLSSGNTTFTSSDVESATLSTILLGAGSQCLSFGDTLVPSGDGHQREVIQGP